MSTPITVGSVWQGRKPYPLRRVSVVQIDGDQTEPGGMACWVITESILGDNGQPVNPPRRSRSRLGGFLKRYDPYQGDTDA